MSTRWIVFLSAALLATGSAQAVPIPTRFDARGADRRAIEALLATYTKAVSSKNQALFETLLLDTDIPFSGIGAAPSASGGSKATHDYAGFRDGVFAGPAFTQSFQNVRIEQDGALAQVSLVFVNRSAQGSSWGWKTLQLLKSGGRWQIASEFYTGHPG